MALQVTRRAALALLGVVLLLVSPARAGSPDEPFALVVLPDTQNYCNRYDGSRHRAHFHAQTRWIAENAERLDVAFVLHAGDVTETDSDEEWPIARAAMARLDGIVPYAICLGNHDMGYGPSGNGTSWTHALNRETRFDAYFPAGELDEPGRSALVETFEGSLANAAFRFERAGMRFLIVALEYKPRDEALGWANGVIAERPEHRVVVLTHTYLGCDGSRMRGPDGTRVRGNDGEGIWEKLVSRHANVFLVICGHVSGEARAESRGVHGNVVHELLADYQTLPEGGGSWLRVLIFHPAEDRIEVSTYNPARDEHREGPESRFDLHYAMLAGRASAAPASFQEKRAKRETADPADHVDLADAVEALSAGFADGSLDAAAALVAPEHRELRASPEFRTLMREHLTGASLAIVGEDEPGTPLVVTGVVRDTEGNPIKGAQILVYQTDARGWYGVERSDDDENPRLYGFLRTGPDGRYEVRTIRPAHYAHSSRTPAHVHFAFRAEGYRRARGGGPPSLFFADDPVLTPAHRAEIEDDGARLAEPERDDDGIERCTYDFVMKRD